jgi:hypothetical protein
MMVSLQSNTRKIIARTQNKRRPIHDSLKKRQNKEISLR